MSDFTTAIRTAFEHTDYDVADVSQNRQSVRIAIRQEGPEPAAFRAIVEEAIGADGFFGFNVTTERIDGQDTVGTVVTFQKRG